jgi:hypothetical protein
MSRNAIETTTTLRSISRIYFEPDQRLKSRSALSAVTPYYPLLRLTRCIFEALIRLGVCRSDEKVLCTTFPVGTKWVAPAGNA